MPKQNRITAPHSRECATLSGDFATFR